MQSPPRPSVLLLGESPPPRAPPDFRPFDCDSGDRLAKRVIGLRSRAALLDHIPRANVFDTPGIGVGDGPRWAASDAAAKVRARLRHPDLADVRTVVALGGRPLEAIGLDRDLAPATMGRLWIDVSAGPGDLRRRCVDVLALPHPSGQSRALNDPVVLFDCRAALLPEIVAGCPGLRPWHFRLDDPVVLRDLAVAVHPLRPDLAAAALVIAAEVRAAGDGVGAGPQPGDVWSLRAYAEHLDEPLTVADLCERLAAMHSRGPILAREIRQRARLIARGLLREHPPDPAVVRATHARLVALGVLR